jgi:hypothetical protein
MTPTCMSTAYCHITIPSLLDVFRKLQLLFFLAQISLLNQCLPQTDAFLKGAISIIPDLPSRYEDRERAIAITSCHNEDRLVGYILELLSFLVLVPGHPEHGPFYILQGLSNALPLFAWQPYSGWWCWCWRCWVHMSDRLWLLTWYRSWWWWW